MTFINTPTLERKMDINLKSLIETRTSILNELNEIEAQYDRVLEQFSKNPSPEQKIRLKPRKDHLYDQYLKTIERLETATATLASYSPIVPSVRMDNVRHA